MMHNLPEWTLARNNHASFCPFLLSTKTNYASYFASCIFLDNRKKCQRIEFGRLRDELHWSHASTRYVSSSCADQFSRVKICFDTFYYLRDRKVPDLERRTRPVCDQNQANQTIVFVFIVFVVVKGFGGEKRENRARSTGWHESLSYRQRYKCSVEAALMKQMRTCYMQLGRTEIRAPLPERQRKQIRVSNANSPFRLSNACLSICGS